MISALVEDKALYSASAEDLVIVVCFVVCQMIGFLPRKIQKPVMECHVEGQAAQSELANAEGSSGESDANNSLVPGEPLMYLCVL